MIKRRKILFIVDAELKNPVRGTPLRIVNFLHQIARAHELTVCARDLDPIVDVTFLAYPIGSRWQRVKELAKYIKEHQIEIVMTATESNLKLPLLLKLKTGVKIAIDLHGLDHEELLFAGRISASKAWLKRMTTQLLLLPYDHIYGVTEKLLGYYWGLKRKSTAIYGGVNLQEFKPLEATPHEDFVISYMGNNRAYQGWDALLTAMEELGEVGTKVRLRLIMSGKEEEIRTSLSGRSISASIDLHCNVPHEEVNPLMAGCDVLVIPRPSLAMTEYAYPSKLPEYLATGIPTMVTDVGPVKELPNFSSAVIIIGHDNISTDLTAALKRFMSLSVADRRAVGMAGRHYVEQNLSWQIIGDTLNQSLALL